jgi:ribose transport system ATP-binding protein
VGLFGEEVEIRSPAQAVRCGIAYLSEDRQGTGIHTDFSVIHNVTMISLRKYCRILIRGRAEAERASYYVDAFNIKTESLRTRLEHLSGGNQQKVALAKELDTEPAIFIFDEPTRGIDIKAKSEIYAFVRHLVEQGIACIVISSDLEEVIGLCDRVAVMRAGHLAGILSGDRICEEEIMYLATGVK